MMKVGCFLLIVFIRFDLLFELFELAVGQIQFSA